VVFRSIEFFVPRPDRRGSIWLLLQLKEEVSSSFTMVMAAQGAGLFRGHCPVAFRPRGGLLPIQDRSGAAADPAHHRLILVVIDIRVQRGLVVIFPFLEYLSVRLKL
jgi:hypothetical protein